MSNINIVTLEDLQGDLGKFWTESFEPRDDFKFEEYTTVPYAPFNRMEKLHRILESTQQREQRNNYRFNNYQGQNQGSNPNSYQNQYQQREEQKKKAAENEFITVDNVKTKQTKGPHQRVQRPQQPQQQQPEFQQRSKHQKKQKNIRGFQEKVQHIKFRDPIQIKQNWRSIKEIFVQKFDPNQKIKINIEEIHKTGKLKKWNKKIESIKPKNPAKIATQKIMNNIDTNIYNDSIFVEELQNRNSDPNQVKSQYTVYVADTYLMALMTLEISEFPWYLWITKQNNDIVIKKYDKEKDNISYLDLQTIDENSTTTNNLKNFIRLNLDKKKEQDKFKQRQDDEETIVMELCQESTHISNTLQTGTLNEKEEYDYGEGEDNTVDCGPSLEGKKAFRYIKVEVDQNIEIISRVTLDAYIDGVDEDGDQVELPILIRQLNEYDLTNQWRSQEPGRLLINQIQRNLCNFRKWMIQMELADVQTLKLASVSRLVSNSSSRDQHEILQVSNYTYKDLKSNTAFNTEEGWKQVRYIINQIIQQPDGDYIIIHNAYKTGKINLYKLPDDDDQEVNEDEEQEDNQQEDENDDLDDEEEDEDDEDDDFVESKK